MVAARISLKRWIYLEKSGFQAVCVLFNHGVDEDFAGDALDFALGFRGSQRSVESEYEILALANVLDATILHLGQRFVDGLSLRIEDGAAEHHVDMGLHRS